MKFMNTLCALLMVLPLTACIPTGDSGSGYSTAPEGQGGSTARFSLIGDYLYAINDYELKLFDISDVSQPHVYARTGVDFGIETLFATDDYLFIGGRFGIYIYDRSDPANPTFISEFSHAQSCDPVVTDGSYAYVTLRSDTLNCAQSSLNTLVVVSLDDIYAPEQVSTFTMQSPRGLGLDSVNQRLYVCDDTAGLKVFDLSEPAQPELLNEYTEYDVVCQDVIVVDETHLVVSNATSIIQYDISALPLTKLSEVSGFAPGAE